MNSLLIRDCSQVVTVDQTDTIQVLEEAAVLCEDGYVAAVGEPGQFAGHRGEVVSARGGVVSPGLVDCHTHLVFGGSRCRDLELKSQGKAYQEIAAAGGGIHSTVAQTRGLTLDQMVDIGRARIRAAMAMGTTTLEAKSGYGLDFETEAKILQAYRSLSAEGPVQVFSTYLGLHAVPEGKSKVEYVHEVCTRHLPMLAERGLVDSVDAFVEEGYFSAEDARTLATVAQHLGIAIHLHVDQFGDSGGAALAAELGASTADHLEHTGAAGIEAMASSRVVPVLLPGSVVGLGLHRFPDARAKLDAGLPVAVATDFNPGSSPMLSLPLAMGLACRYMAMTPAEALVATTANAARALGLYDRGRLAPGERADLALWQVSDYREIATYFGLNLCLGTVIGGRTYLASQ
ncbi:MAG: imidazolonepropionase [Fimbriimonadaceae bacterium]